MSILRKLKTPVFKAEGIQHIDRTAYELEFFDGPRLAASLSLGEILSLPQTTLNLRMTSVSGWSVRANWQGVLWQDMMSRAGLPDTAQFVVFESPSEYTTNVYGEDILPDRWIFCHSVDGEHLEDEYGGPLRMIIPNLWGYKCCKWLVKVRYCDKNEPGYWETRGYTDRGLIEPGETLDVNTGTKRPIAGGEVLEF